uniref:Integrase catalytic domain-containing protein n=1 Tax=Heliothis virescens TaxID=7102 RepID=A0A2A4K8V1_HELVI
MSVIEPVHQQNSETPAIVDKDEFFIELQNYYRGLNKNSKKLQWTNQRIQNVIKLLEEYNTAKSEGRRPTNQHYYHARKYDVMNIDSQKVLIIKRKNTSDPVVQIIPSEEFYQKILDVHIATGHGRRDKIVHALKNKYVVPIFAISIFLNMCRTCLSKKSFPKTGIVKPLISDDFNRRGQIDLIDLQTTPDQEFKWLLQYQDHLTKFCFLRPLKSKEAKEVAIEILKIFLEVGCPHILQSDNGRKFTASVIKEIGTLWPACKIVNGGPRHPQSQESIECSNQDVKKLIHTWMTDNKSTNWSFGCYFVQFQKNSSHHSIIARTPYNALFGHDPKLGLSSTNLSKNIISKLENEEDLQKLIEETNNNKEQNSEEVQEQENVNISITDSQKIKQEETTAPSHEINMLTEIKIENNPELLPVAYENLPKVEEVGIHKCSTADKMISTSSIKIEYNPELLPVAYENSSIVEEVGIHNCSVADKIITSSSIKIENNPELLPAVHEDLPIITEVRSHKRSATDKMISMSSKKFKDVSTGSAVLVEVPRVNLYQVGTVLGIINNWMPQNAVLSCPNTEPLSDIPKVPIPLRTVATMSSPFGGQGIKQCNCKKIKNGQCISKKCNCKKSNVLCNSRCHSSLICNNKTTC